MDLEDVLAAISSFAGVDLPRPDSDAVRRSVREEIADYVLSNPPDDPSRKTTDEQLGLLLRELRAPIITLGRVG
jgi:hypothetical protein